jgi:hypothetical protein
MSKLLLVVRPAGLCRGAIGERAAAPRGVGQGRRAPGAVRVVQVGPGRHDLVDAVEGCVVQDEWTLT